MAYGDLGGTKYAGTGTASALGVMALPESFFPASCSWRSEGLFDLFFSVAPPIQAVRGLPCLGSFSVVQCHRHLEGAHLAGVILCRSAHQALKGAPWVGSYSVVQCIRHLMGQPFCCSAANAGVWGERGYGDGPPPTRASAVSPCFHGCLAFLHGHFASQSPPSHPLNPSLRGQQQP